MTRHMLLLSAPLMAGAMIGFLAQSARAGGTPAPAASDSIISAPSLSYSSGWVVSVGNAGFSYDAAGDLVVSGSTGIGKTTYSYSANMAYGIYNETGVPASNTSSVNITAGGEVSSASSTFYATSTTQYSSGTATGYAPYGISNTSYTDVTYVVDNISTVQPGDSANYSGSGSGSGYSS